MYSAIAVTGYSPRLVLLMMPAATNCPSRAGVIPKTDARSGVEILSGKDCFFDILAYFVKIKAKKMLAI